MPLMLPLTPAGSFAFSAPHPLASPLPFAAPSNGYTTSILKRPLHATSCSGARKKRRLRRDLITSPLSRPFSTPASHIANRGSCKVAVWARQHHLGKGLLRKTALLNSLKSRVACNQRANPNFAAAAEWTAREKACHTRVQTGGSEDNLVRLASAKASFSFGRNKAPHLAVQPPERTVVESKAPPAPSPVGLSNYDALDEDDGYAGFCISFDEEEVDENEYRPHPDWARPETRVLEPEPPDRLSLLPSPSPSPPNFLRVAMQLDSNLEPIVGLNPLGTTAWQETDDRRPPSPPDEGILKILREAQKVRQVREGGLWTGLG